MSVTALGLVVFALCLRFAGSADRLVQIVLLAGVFEAAAAAIIGPFGLQPGLVPGIMLVALVGLQYMGGRRSVVEGPVFHILGPLLLLAGYGAVTAILMPDLFAGRIIVWPQKFDFERPEPLPLAPGQGNTNQVLYLLANVSIAFATALAMGRAGTPWRGLVKAYLASGYLVVLLSAWQFVSRTAGVPFPTEFLYSNPSWGIVEQSLGALPRLQGPFTEPSALAFYLSGMTMACAMLCLRGHRVMRPDLLLMLCILTVFLSTSTTGIAAVAIGLPAILVLGATQGGGNVGRLTRVLALPFGTLVLGFAALAILRPEILDAVGEVVSATLGKAGTESFTERGEMNDAAWQAFLASHGLGIGWGSTRSSSMVPGLLAGGGVVGVVAALWCGVRMRRALRAARAFRGHPATVAIDCFAAAAAGQLLAAVIAAPIIVTPIFFVQVGILAAAGARVALDARSLVPRRMAWPRPEEAASAADELQGSTV